MMLHLATTISVALERTILAASVALAASDDGLHYRPVLPAESLVPRPLIDTFCTALIAYCQALAARTAAAAAPAAAPATAAAAAAIS